MTALSTKLITISELVEPAGGRDTEILPGSPSTVKVAMNMSAVPVSL